VEEGEMFVIVLFGFLLCFLALLLKISALQNSEKVLDENYDLELYEGPR
jgi:hypothetical protein